ncbi:peroxisome biogenesis factor 2 isoform X2 [Hippocampus comes]|uniref:Peroxisome biogenesis factor 2 n=1 Tax=Hippocampus comes TaxID=109280 RepID=A0A3Q2XZ29_HIPCM|nr:PREDICTED: peroxisome biogenesis factor 2 isoform X2 [Hippocampus comes]
MGMEKEGESTCEPATPVLRISQLDALELDSALEQLLWTQLCHCFQNLRPGLLTPLEPELKALLQLLLWRFTLYPGSATVGQSLLSLRYRNISTSPNLRKSLSHRQKLALLLLTVGPRWLQERSHSLRRCLGLTSGAPLSDGFQKALRNSLAALSGLARLASLVNFLAFLRTGYHPVLAERMVGAQAVFSEPSVTRDVTYQYVNRELLWHGFAEFLIFLLPLINTSKVKASIYSFVLGGDPSGVGGARDKEGAWRECALCGEWPTMPHALGCPHVFCYYCIKSQSIANNCVRCPKCGTEARRLEPAKIETLLRH